MSMPASDLRFNLFQHLIMLRLCFIPLPRKTLRKHKRYSFLIFYELIDYSDSRHISYSLSEKGKMYLRHSRERLFTIYVPIILSVIALLAGYDVYKIPFVQEILDSIKSLFQNLLGS